MRRPQRLIAATVLTAMSVVLAGCSSGGFDPTDMMDWFDTKKKLPGDRRAVFPEGVPGVEQGVPKDLYRGAQQQQDQPPVVEAPPPEPKAKSRKATKSAARTPAPAAAPEPAPEAAPDNIDEGGTAAAPPAPPPPKRKRTRITAPDADPAPPPRQQQAAPASQQAAPQQQSSSPFPAPLPSGGFSR